jgi:hypothetical protein
VGAHPGWALRGEQDPLLRRRWDPAQNAGRSGPLGTVPSASSGEKSFASNTSNKYLDFFFLLLC